MSICRASIPILVAAMSALIAAPNARANVKPNALFSDNAILQQGMPVPVWGTARDGERVTVAFRGQRATTTARNGRWMVRLGAMKAGGPFEMTISGDNVMTLRNIMVGEVWVCSGQSNMEWWVGVSANAERTLANCDDPKMRLFHVPLTASDTPESDVNAQWQEASRSSVTFFSAAGYYFGRDLRKSLGVPIGLIDASMGSSMAEAWMRRDILERDPSFRKAFDLKWTGDDLRLRPTGAYNAMLHPLIPFAIRGAIWYQGESNADRPLQYRTLFPALIESWRDEWGQGEFPFLFVQLAPLFRKQADPVEPYWGGIRESQLVVSRTVPNTAMAVITDYGEEMQAHPRAKEPVGARLALAARAIAYGEKIEYSGPIFRSMAIHGDRAVLSFTHTGSGLMAKGGELTGFAICGDDGKFAWARASIQGERVVVSSPSVTHPAAVRYGWADFPVVNLYNKEDLPASPFRTDDFPLSTGAR